MEDFDYGAIAPLLENLLNAALEGEMERTRWATLESGAGPH